MTFSPVTPDMSLQSSLSPLLNRDEMNRSNNAGTTFPIDDLELGVTCWRVDLQRLYVLTGFDASNNPTWDFFLRSGDSSVFIGTTGGFVAGTIEISTNAAGTNYGNLLALHNDPSDPGQVVTTGYASTGPQSLVSIDRKTVNGTVTDYLIWDYNLVNRTFNFDCAGGLKVGGNTVWHAGNDGAGSGLDAGTLAGQTLANIQAWANITGKPTFSDAATTSVAAIRAGIGLSGYLALSGGTLTGSVSVNNGQGTAGLFADLFQFNNTIAGLGHVSGSNPTAIGLYIDGTTYRHQFLADGTIWTTNYGFLDQRFATRATSLSMGGLRTINCSSGNFPASEGYEVYDTGNGVHQIRPFVNNCSQCNCNCSVGDPGSWH